MKKEIIVNGNLQGEKLDNRKAILYKGKPLGEIPKSYKKISVLSHNIGNNYNSSIITIYQTKDKTFRYEIYRDGSFYPYYGKIEFSK